MLVIAGHAADSPENFDCRTCGACCSYAADWPRFTLESDDELDYLPPELVRTDLGGMACDGNRCRALAGNIGQWTSCTIHPIRPDVCRACQPGDPECQMARRSHGLPPFSVCAGSLISG